jgi:hypothetical protein
MLTRLKQKRGEPELEDRLAELEESAARATNGYEAQHLMQAAELCAGAGQTERALRYMGGVLDRYLETGRHSAAEALCRRMLTLAPSAVRVRGTRVWLAAAGGSVPEIRAAVGEYVRSYSSPEQERLVALQLDMLAAASTCEVRELAAGALLELGAAARADHWLGLVYGERNGTCPPTEPLAGHEWDERMLEAALLRPEQAPSPVPEELPA